MREIRGTGAQVWGVQLQDARGGDPLEWRIRPDRLWKSVAEAMEEDREVPAEGGTFILGSLVLVGEVMRWAEGRKD